MNIKNIRNKAYVMAHGRSRKKMYKSGKLWLVAGATLLAMTGAGMAVHPQVQANADTNEVPTVSVAGNVSKNANAMHQKLVNKASQPASASATPNSASAKVAQSNVAPSSASSSASSSSASSNLVKSASVSINGSSSASNAPKSLVGQTETKSMTTSEGGNPATNSGETTPSDIKQPSNLGSYNARTYGSASDASHQKNMNTFLQQNPSLAKLWGNQNERQNNSQKGVFSVSNKNKKLVLKDSTPSPNFFSGTKSADKQCDNLTYNTYSNGGIEFTKGTLSQILGNYFKADEGNAPHDARRDISKAKAIKFDSDVVNPNIVSSDDDMGGMFQNDSSLQSIDISNLDTSNNNSTDYMFAGDSDLQSIEWGRFNTSNVSNMHDMFDYDISLKSLDLSGFDTSNVSDMGGMFYQDTALQSLDLSNFDTNKVKTMRWMFASDNNLTNLNLGGKFSTKAVLDDTNMFGSVEPQKLQEITLSANDKFSNKSGFDKIANGWYKTNGKKDANGKLYTVGTAQNLGNGSNHAGTWVKEANPEPVFDNVTFEYQSPKNPNEFREVGEPIQVHGFAGNSDNISSDVPSDYQLVNTGKDTGTFTFGDYSNATKGVPTQNGYHVFLVTPKTKTNDIPAVPNTVDISGTVDLHFTDKNNNNVKDVYLPYTIQDSDGKQVNILNYVISGVIKSPSKFSGKFIDGFNTNNYDYQGSSKSSDGTKATVSDGLLYTPSDTNYDNGSTRLLEHNVTLNFQSNGKSNSDMNDTIQYVTSDGQVLASDELSGQAGNTFNLLANKPSTDNNASDILASNVPAGYSLANKTNSLKYDGFSHDIRIVPNENTTTIHFVDQNNEPAGNPEPVQAKTNAPFTDIPHGYHLPAGVSYHFDKNGNLVNDKTDATVPNNTVQVLGDSIQGKANIHIDYQVLAPTGSNVVKNDYVAPDDAQVVLNGQVGGSNTINPWKYVKSDFSLPTGASDTINFTPSDVNSDDQNGQAFNPSKNYTAQAREAGDVVVQFINMDEVKNGNITASDVITIPTSDNTKNSWTDLGNFNGLVGQTVYLGETSDNNNGEPINNENNVHYVLHVPNGYHLEHNANPILLGEASDANTTNNASSMSNANSKGLLGATRHLLGEMFGENTKGSAEMLPQENNSQLKDELSTTFGKPVGTVIRVGLLGSGNPMDNKGNNQPAKPAQPSQPSNPTPQKPAKTTTNKSSDGTTINNYYYDNTSDNTNKSTQSDLNKDQASALQVEQHDNNEIRALYAELAKLNGNQNNTNQNNTNTTKTNVPAQAQGQATEPNTTPKHNVVSDKVIDITSPSDTTTVYAPKNAPQAKPTKTTTPKKNTNKHVAKSSANYVYNVKNIVLLHGRHSIKISKKRGFTGRILKSERKHGRNYLLVSWRGKKFLVNAKQVRNAYIQPSEFNHKAHGLFKHATIKLRKSARIYNSTHYTKKHYRGTVRAGKKLTVVGVKSIGRKGYKQTRLVLSDGLIITANKNYVEFI